MYQNPLPVNNTERHRNKPPPFVSKCIANQIQQLNKQISSRLSSIILSQHRHFAKLHRDHHIIISILRNTDCDAVFISAEPRKNVFIAHLSIIRPVLETKVNAGKRTRWLLCWSAHTIPGLSGSIHYCPPPRTLSQVADTEIETDSERVKVRCFHNNNEGTSVNPINYRVLRSGRRALVCAQVSNHCLWWARQATILSI